MTIRLKIPDVMRATGGRLVQPADASATGGPAGASHQGGSGTPEVITGVATDSRQVTPGDIFVALRGPNADGHAFVADAFARGATLAVVRDAAGAGAGPVLVVPDPLRALGAIAALHRQTLEATVVGITGSVGKTTTVALCAKVLETRYRVARSAESWNAELGVALTMLGIQATHDIAVVELAMRGLGEIRDLVAIARPRIGAVTTIGDTHLELLGSREQIAAAKAELLEGLPADGVAIVNADEALTDRLIRNVHCRIVPVGTSRDAEVRATAITRINGNGYTFHLTLGAQEADVILPLPGTHQVRNAVVAAAVGHIMHLTPREIVAGLARARPAKMRQELVTIGDVLLIDDTYNASPQSMDAAFEVMAQVGGRRRRILVLGEMRELGPQSEEFHRRVGQRAAALSPACLLVVGPNARAYLDGAAAGGLQAHAMASAETTAEAIPLLRHIVQPGDVVLIKGSRAIEMERLADVLRAPAPVGNA
ncbi:MAG TPA: UDP-N-acetylmuramoyl-tripeptide--D-alanyl-D-alanine ligase [bacterium]|nr:UDP-N-acetylmuramoyl-tripeptide--D-alanyl-D-alanine ligase [bacterium]